MIAPLVVWRRGEDDFLLLTEPELGDDVRDAPAPRMRIASRCEIELEEHTSAIVFGEGDGHPDARLRRAGGRGARRRDATPSRADEELERLRILARTPRWGREIDEGILPAEAGLDERAVSFTKGCYPGQEPLARLHNRGHVNRDAARARARRRRPAAGDEVVVRGRGGRPRHERRSGTRARLRARRGARRAPSSRSSGQPARLH